MTSFRSRAPISRPDPTAACGRVTGHIRSRSSSRPTTLSCWSFCIATRRTRRSCGRFWLRTQRSCSDSKIRQISAAVAKYMVRRRGPPIQGWRTFLRNHAPDIAAMDMFMVPTIGFKLLYGFVIVRIVRGDLVWIMPQPTRRRSGSHARWSTADGENAFDAE